MDTAIRPAMLVYKVVASVRRRKLCKRPPLIWGSGRRWLSTRALNLQDQGRWQRNVKYLHRRGDQPVNGCV